MTVFADLLTHSLDQSFIMTVLISYLGGVLTSFTPCVYPLVPITAGVIGARSINPPSRKHSLSMLLTYIMGISVVYTALGMAAALTGRLFGTIGNTTGITLTVGFLIILFGLNMMDLIPLKIPAFEHTRYTRHLRGFGGTFLMGIASGFVFAPCTAPVMGVLLTWVGTTRNWVTGSLAMFSFTWGLSTLLIIVGLFSGSLRLLPKSGLWMVYIKRSLGGIMIAIGLYFISQPFLG